MARTEAERAHLFDLARTAIDTVTVRTRRRAPRQHVRPGVQRILDAMNAAPACVRNGRRDILVRTDPVRSRRGAIDSQRDVPHAAVQARNVRQHRSGIKHLHHPVVGDLTLTYESMERTADAGLRLNAYTPNRAPHRRTRSTCSPVGQPPPVSRRARRPSTGPDRLPGRAAAIRRHRASKEIRGDSAQAAEHEGSGGDVQR
ncbi:MAG: hypothetical protein WBL53_15155 [Pseudonocardiaceae bacterium]